MGGYSDGQNLFMVKLSVWSGYLQFGLKCLIFAWWDPLVLVVPNLTLSAENLKKIKQLYLGN